MINTINTLTQAFIQRSGYLSPTQYRSTLTDDEISSLEPWLIINSENIKKLPITEKLLPFNEKHEKESNNNYSIDLLNLCNNILTENKPKNTALVYIYRHFPVQCKTPLLQNLLRYAPFFSSVYGFKSNAKTIEFNHFLFANSLLSEDCNCLLIFDSTHHFVTADTLFSEKILYLLLTKTPHNIEISLFKDVNTPLNSIKTMTLDNWIYQYETSTYEDVCVLFNDQLGKQYVYYIKHTFNRDLPTGNRKLCYAK